MCRCDLKIFRFSSFWTADSLIYYHSFRGRLPAPAQFSDSVLSLSEAPRLNHREKTRRQSLVGRRTRRRRT